MEDRGSSLAGTVFEQRYRVDTLLARGGMSAVYRGLDTRLDRPVAIKVMDPRFAADRDFVDRFEREARSAARIHHPNVVAVHDQGLDGDQVYLVMELVDGGTLRDLLTERGGLGTPLALSIMEPVLGALAAAHQAGLVHRDVKPENVLIGANGVVKVGDFGLVRAIASAGTTSSNVILGTVAYLSPEQVSTGAATARGDVYSAGILLYEMLAGVPPYVGDNPLSVAYRHVNDDVPALTSAGLPPEVTELVLRATRRDPASRPLTGGAFLIDLERVRATARIPRVAVPVPRYHLVDLTMPVSAEEQARALGLDAPAPAGVRAGTLDDPAEAPTVVPARPVSLAGLPHPIDSATTVRKAPAGFQAMGPQGTRAMLRADLGPAAVDAPVLIAPPPPSPAYGTRYPHLPPGGPVGGQPVGGQPVGGQPVGGQPAKPPAAKKNRVLLWSLLGVLLLAVAGTATWWFAAGRWTSVPAVVNQDQAGAERALTDSGLRAEVVKTRDNQVQAGKVIRTEPANGARALRGDHIRLIVSSGRPRVPDVQPGTSIAQATSAIEAEQLRAQPDDGQADFDDTIPKGAVVRLKPAAGTELNIGTSVTIVVSKGPKPKPIPDVHGKTRDEAFQVLRDNGFEPFDAPKEFSPEVDGGQVIKTNPAANQLAKDDKRVGVVVSNAITVPDVSRRSVGEARQILGELGLQVEVQQLGQQNDNSRVFTQNPPPGSRVPENSRILLFAFL